MSKIPMKSNGAVDHSSLSTINHIKVQGILNAQNVTSLNRSSAANPTSAQSASDLYSGRQQRQPAAHSPVLPPSGTQTHPRMPAGSGTGAPPSSTVSHGSNSSVRTSASQNSGSSRTPAGQNIGSSRTPAGQNIGSSRTPAGQNPGSSRTPASSHSQAPSRMPAVHPQTSAAPQQLQHKLPPLRKPVQKGQKVPLSAGTPLGQLTACFGWNTSNAQCDVDVSAFLLGADGRVPGDDWFVFYGQPESPDKSCRFQTSNALTAAGAQDLETIRIDFNRLHSKVKKIVFVLTINEAFQKKLHFGMIKDAYIRILGPDNKELVSFQMTDYYSNVISMMIGEIYDYKGTWKFHAVGNGVAKDLAGLCALYGVQVV